jgi:predicted O-methyltransferase YrrM
MIENFRNKKKDSQIKLVLLKFFKRNNIFIKSLAVIKNSYHTFKIIRKFSIKYSIIFLPKIIYGNFFYEKNRDNNNEKKIYFEAKYKFSYDDWFSYNITMWEKFIINKIYRINYLEIGSFEGRSTAFIGELKNTNSITAIDTWEGSDEHNNISFKKVFENFKKNINILNKSNIRFFKTTSDNFFKNNKNVYNLIYIDGNHEYTQVKKDFVNSLNCTEKNGYIICDDFLWFFYQDLNKNPIKAILECYNEYKKELTVEFLNHQIIFKKIH